MENSTDDTAFSFNETESIELGCEYVCKESSNVSCPIDCVSLEACMDCECQVAFLEDTGGPWGQVMDLIFCLLPIIYLVYATIKPNPTPTTLSLPISAAIMFLVRLMYLGSNPILTSSCVILGFHEAITPLTIMAGAITLFETMEATRCLPYMMREMKALTAGHPVAECMLLFAFAYLIEGASGFGTPVALGAPMLVSTGHPALESVVILLLFNTFATVWGAVGTPLWFGFGGLPLSEDDFLEISLRAAIAMVVSSFLLLPFILTILVPFVVVKKNLVFLFLSIATVMGPVVGLASVNYEFPALIGGLVGCVLMSILIKYKVGLSPYDPEVDGHKAETAQDDSEENITKQSTAKSQDSPTPSSDVPAVISTGENSTAAASNGIDSKPITSSQEQTTKMVSSINGHWNVEVETDLDVKDDSAATTIVFVAPSTSNVEDPAVNVETSIAVTEAAKPASTNTPPLVEENGNPSEQLNEEQFKMSVMSAAERSMMEENELLGPRKTYAEGYLSETLLRTFPIWGVVLTLMLTRIQPIGIKEYLTKQEPYFDISFGTYGEFRLSVSLVIMLKDIMTYPGVNWKYELLYIPFLIPFVLISVITMVLYHKDLTRRPQDIAATVAGRLANPAIALAGALVLVQLMIKNGEESPAFLLGTILADWLKQGFVVICPLLGALGSFFSGSTTVSNLTFGEIQYIAAVEIGTSVNTMLALQVVGASAGNGICLNNIIAALTVVGLDVSEGQILMRTFKYVFLSTTIATAVMLALFFRFD